LILEEIEAFGDDVEKEVSECEDHLHENSDRDFKAEVEIEHQIVTK